MWKKFKFDAKFDRHNFCDMSRQRIYLYIYFLEILIEIICTLASSYDPSLIVILIGNNMPRKL